MLKYRRGSQKAIIAIAHDILRTAYYLLDKKSVMPRSSLRAL